MTIVETISEYLGIDAQEGVVLSIFSAVSAFMFVGSLEYNRDAGLFPRITALVVIFGVLLIALRRFFPEPFYAIIAGEGSAFSREEFEPEVSADDETSQEVRPDNRPEKIDRRIGDSVFTAISLVGYVGVGYLIGLLWATPLFVYAYTRWFDQPRRVVWALVTASFVVAVAFLVFLNLPISTGLVHEVLGLA